MKLLFLSVLVGLAFGDIDFVPFSHQQLPPPIPRDRAISDSQWITQAQDQFDDTNTNTYEQQYWYNDEFCSLDNAADCPIFLMINGESPASPYWLTSGQWYLMAEEHGALMFTIEHRYYGDSLPTETWSDENMVYLSSEQALADIADFVQEMNSMHGLTGPWLTFGGSYAGSLSAWARQIYPDDIWAAVSSSGPLEAKLDFWEYYETAFDALGTTVNGADCQSNYTAAFAAAEEMLKDPEQALDLYSMMLVCDPNAIEDELDMWTFGHYFNSVIGSVVQYNGFDSYTIDDICETLTDPLGGDPLDRYATMTFQVKGGSCSRTEYENVVTVLSHENPNGGLLRQWCYQTCTEFGWYQTSNLPGGQQGDENMHPVELEEMYCVDVFGLNQDDLQGYMDVTNDYYGGKTPEGVTRIVYVNGSIDPWHRMGIYEADLNEDAPAIYIQGSSHCADMYEDSSITSPELEEARAEIRQLVATWIDEYYA